MRFIVMLWQNGVKGVFLFVQIELWTSWETVWATRFFSDPLRFVFICRNNLFGTSMASTLQFQGVQGNLGLALRRSLLHFKPQIGFAAIAGPVCGRRILSNRVAFSVTCKASRSDVIEKSVSENGKVSEGETSYTCVMKFGGSSVASAERMKEVANLILSFPEERPIVVLSAMGKTTNKLLLVFFCALFLILCMLCFSPYFVLCWSRTFVEEKCCLLFC